MDALCFVTAVEGAELPGNCSSKKISTGAIFFKSLHDGTNGHNLKGTKLNSVLRVAGLAAARRDKDRWVGLEGRLSNRGHVGVTLIPKLIRWKQNFSQEEKPFRKNPTLLRPALTPAVSSFVGWRTRVAMDIPRWEGDRGGRRPGCSGCSLLRSALRRWGRKTLRPCGPPSAPTERGGGLASEPKPARLSPALRVAVPRTSMAIVYQRCRCM